MTLPDLPERVTDYFILIRMPEHPRASFGYVTEQVLVAETYLGRGLYPDEEVRQINGKPHDNRPENLRVSSGSSRSVSLTEEVEKGIKPLRTFVPCKFQKVCWATVRAPMARREKIFLPYVCSFQSDGDVYKCSHFWRFKETEIKEGEINSGTDGNIPA
jgi:hypothetical protein